VSLTGAVRAVPQATARMKESAKLGFTRAVIPDAGRGDSSEGLSTRTVSALDALVADIGAAAQKIRRIPNRDAS